MDGKPFPDDCAKQWEILLLLLATEEKKRGITAACEVKTMDYFCKHEGINILFKHWLAQMQESYANKNTESDTAKKSEAISLYWRQQGNDCFKKSLVKESYSCYTKSVLYAEPHGKMYPLALANRSAALLHMKRFEHCLQDIEIALKNDYPKEQHHKLFLRQTDCYLKLNQSAKARTTLQIAKEHIQDANAQPSQNSEFQRHLITLESKLNTIDETDILDEQEVLPSYLESENINFVSASESVVVRDAGDRGRRVVTEMPVQRGAVLFDEEAYAIVALPVENNRPIVCEACCRGEMNAMPCKYCSRSVYCSESCRDEAWKVFHQWECAGAQADLFPTIGIAHLALRVLLMSAEKGFPPVDKGEGTKLTVADLFKEYGDVDKTQIYRRVVPDFYRMFNLVTNFDKMKTMDFIQYALTATMLTLYLEHYTSFFEHLQSRLPFSLSRDDIKMFCAALMLRHLGQLVCNGHSAQTLTTFIPEEETGIVGKTVCEREVRYSTAIYPSAAMMNHSCEPNIINTFYRNRLVIRCARDLAVGTEVLNCYGPHKSRDTYKQRRSQLYHQYCFKCECDICADVDRRDFVLLFSAFMCRACKGPVIRGDNVLRCVNCKTTEYDLKRASRIMDRADALVAQVQRSPQEQNCEKVRAILRLKQKVLHKHNVELRQTADDLARLYTEHGEYDKSIEIIKQNIQSLEYQYGSISVEVAMDLRKLADVMLERIIRSTQQPVNREWCLETNKVLKKTVQLTELNYGSWEPLVKRLRGQEASVAALLRDTWPHADSIHHNMHYNLKI